MRPENANDKPPPDYRQQVTDDIIKLLESGTAPWQKPWEEVAGGGMPFNPTTGKPYRGGNVIALMVSEMQHGYTDPRWLTYKQAAEKRWQVRKGEKSTKIEFWEAKPGNKDDDAPEDERKGRLIHRVYSVFNAQQIDGIPQLPKKERNQWEVCDAGEKILNDSGAEIRYGGNRAYYRKDTDHIQLPDREVFKDPAGFYGTAIHELIHNAASPSRLNRDFGGHRFGSEGYAVEELVAEVGAAFLCADLEISLEPREDHASYIATWLHVLAQDNRVVFTAAAHAQRAAEYINRTAAENTAQVSMTCAV
jgi:antirestriction protein ArdC